MTFRKTQLYIVGRWENSSKYGVTSKKLVDGFTFGVDGFAMYKDARSNLWTVTHTASGLGIGIAKPTRKEAAEAAAERIGAIMAGLKAEHIKQAVETFQTMPTEDDIATWEAVNYCSVNNHRFDKVKHAAEKAGLVIRNADDTIYQNGGNINISGSPDKLQEIREIIGLLNSTDKFLAMAAAEPEAPEAAAQEPADQAETHSAEASENLLTSTQQPAEPEITETPETLETSERDPKAAHGPVPEKTWIGTSLTGNGWKIFFNPKANRTQISFTSANIPEEVKAILEAERFFYCNSSRTWNKGLKWKAYRAAQRIAEELNKAFPAA